jgi:redox-sensing transcriptional repressor
VFDVRRLPEVVSREHIEIAVITVPASAAAETARRCWDAGLKAILNFAPVQLDPPSDSHLKNVDLKINLETLSFYMARRSESFREISPSPQPPGRGRGRKGEAHAL